MTTGKLRSDEVPQKFIELLPTVGCPAENILSLEKMTRMCRGQYYMVWRSLLEHVQAKDIIRLKRLTVFYDDIAISQEKNLLKERNVSAEMPVQLSLWKEHTDLKQKVTEAEAQVLQATVALNKIIEKISCKVIQRNASRHHIQNLERRSWFLSQVASDLTAKISTLEETLSIADSLCNVDGKPQDDIQNKIDKCMGILQNKKSGGTPSALPLSTPIASSSIVSNHENDNANNDKDDHVLSLVKCRGDILWPHLCERRAEVDRGLSRAYMKPSDVNNRSNVRLLLAHTAAFHSILGLEAIKNKVNIKRTVDMSAASIEDILKYVSEDAFEALVMLFQRAYNEARVKSLRISLEELTSKSGIFDSGRGPMSPVLDEEATLAKVASMNKCIVNTRDELKSLISSLVSIERKIINIRECLLAVFSALHNNTTASSDRCRGVQLDLPVESIALLRQFFTKMCDKYRNVGNLSWNLEMSDSPFVESTENPRFIDELKVYLEKFNLENNRKLVIDSGEKIWIFETLKSLSSKLNARWLNDDITPMLCPTVKPSRALRCLYEPQEKEALIRFLDILSAKHTWNFDIDILAISQQEADTVDKMKKKIRENLHLLQQVDNNIDICHENLQFWSEHQLKKYISANRVVDGKTYKDYETLYLERLKFNW